jgi:hypothetical protein
VESIAGSVIDARARQVALIEQATPTDWRRPSLPPTTPPPARRRSENSTMPASPAPSRRRIATFAVLIGAALVFLGAGVELTRAQGRRDVEGSVARPPIEDPRAPVIAVPALEAPVAADATAPQPAISTPASPAPRPPIAPPRAAVRKKAPAEGEFDHVMDSRK